VNLLPVKTPAEDWLQAGEELGLGIHDLEKIKIEEVRF
jgi:hypothetical protein